LISSFFTISLAFIFIPFYKSKVAFSYYALSGPLKTSDLRSHVRAEAIGKNYHPKLDYFAMSLGRAYRGPDFSAQGLLLPVSPRRLALKNRFR
jgi:hypothetical protein